MVYLTLAVFVIEPTVAFSAICRMIRRLWFWLELSPSNKTPITSPSTSSTRLHSASASASAAPLTPSESQSASVLASSKENKQTEDLKAIGSSSAAVLETKSTEGKGSSLLQSDSVTDQSSCDSGISSDLTSGASSQKIAREDAADVVSGASNQSTAAIAHPLFPNTGNDAVSSSSEVNNQLTHSSQGAPASTTAVFWKPEFPVTSGIKRVLSFNAENSSAVHQSSRIARN